MISSPRSTNSSPPGTKIPSHSSGLPPWIRSWPNSPVAAKLSNRSSPVARLQKPQTFVQLIRGHYTSGDSSFIRYSESGGGKGHWSKSASTWCADERRGRSPGSETVRVFHRCRPGHSYRQRALAGDLQAPPGFGGPLGPNWSEKALRDPPPASRDRRALRALSGLGGPFRTSGPNWPYRSQWRRRTAGTSWTSRTGGPSGSPRATCIDLGDLRQQPSCEHQFVQLCLGKSHCQRCRPSAGNLHRHRDYGDMQCRGDHSDW